MASECCGCSVEDGYCAACGQAAEFFELTKDDTPKVSNSDYNSHKQICGQCSAVDNKTEGVRRIRCVQGAKMVKQLVATEQGSFA